MRRTAIAACGIAAAMLASALARGQAAELTGVAAVSRAILFGLEMPPAERLTPVPADAQAAVAEYRKREKAFKSTLVKPRQPTFEEGSVFEKRVGIERTIFALFPRGDSAKVAAQFALDVEVADEWEGSSEMPRAEARSIDQMLVDLPRHWLAPYMNLIAGHRKLCAAELDGPEPAGDRSALAADYRRQITLARDNGQLLIRIVAQHLLTTGKCFEQ